MSLATFRAQNHPNQLALRGAIDHIDDRALPQAVFDRLNLRFGFSIDVAASTANAKLPRFCSLEDSGLLASWAGEHVYCNPPFSSIEPWVRKAWDEKQCPLSVLLLPANRTEQDWWHNLVEPYRDRPGTPLRTEFWRGRQRFIKAGESSIAPNSRPPFGVMLLIFDRRTP